MNVKGIVWVGSATKDYEKTVAFFKDTMGLSPFHEQDDLSILRLKSGEWVEVFGPGDPHFGEFDTGPVVEFLVDDLDDARAELESKGVEFLTENHGWGDYLWSHFRGPDGFVYGITSGPYMDGSTT
ncbi:MAG TPA: VOC family protein [Gaiella sp.]|jgi:catechol 2,3-dioxygenase-like lactoylglutathione lyase family enzyme|nr:VOC family protein [Gaiella sp.]